MVQNFEFLIGICPGYFQENADVCIPQTPPPPQVVKRLQLGTHSPHKNCGRPLWTASKYSCST